MYPAAKIMPAELLSTYINRAILISGLSDEVNEEVYLSILSKIENTQNHIISLSSGKRLTENRKTKKIFQSYFQSDLKFCQRCIDSDKKLIGFTYFRTFHQSNICYLCPIHKTDLENFTDTNPLSRLQTHDKKFTKALKKLLLNMAEIVMYCYTKERGDFNKEYIQSYIKDFYFNQYIYTKREIRDFIISKQPLELLDFLASSLYKETEFARRNFWGRIFKPNISHEELIFHYCIIEDNPSPVHFFNIVNPSN